MVCLLSAQAARCIVAGVNRHVVVRRKRIVNAQRWQKADCVIVTQRHGAVLLPGQLVKRPMQNVQPQPEWYRWVIARLAALPCE
jgi:hypothetical protein